MRKQYTEDLKIFFYPKVRSSRKLLDILQEKIAHRLLMNCRTYAKLDMRTPLREITSTGKIEQLFRLD